MIGWEYPKLPFGGDEGLVDGLLSLECEVVLLVPTRPRSTAAGVDRGERLRLIPADASFVRYGRADGEDRRDAVSRLAAVARVVARQERFDVIHAHDWMAFPAGLSAASESGRPLLAHLHRAEPAAGALRPADRFVREIERAALRRAERVLCGSPASAGAVRLRHGVDRDRIRIVQDVLDDARTPPGRLKASRCLEAYREVAC